MFFVQCSMLYFQYSRFKVLCSRFNVHCSMFYVLCSMLNVQCSMFYVLCSMFYVLCSMFYALCSMFYVLCPRFTVLCSTFYVLCSKYLYKMVVYVTKKCLQIAKWKGLKYVILWWNRKRPCECKLIRYFSIKNFLRSRFTVDLFSDNAKQLFRCFCCQYVKIVKKHIMFRKTSNVESSGYAQFSNYWTVFFNSVNIT